MLFDVYIETCSDETEAYCRTIEYDYDVEEVTILLLTNIMMYLSI